jgi:bacillithiol system protein YtxJ
MNWNQLTQTNQIDIIKQESEKVPVLVFKHSTRCSISSTALSRLERNWNKNDESKILPYYLDLISNRDISAALAETFSIKHESPQALLIKNGKCIYHASHLEIDLNEILTEAL